MVGDGGIFGKTVLFGLVEVIGCFMAACLSVLMSSKVLIFKSTNLSKSVQEFHHQITH